MDAQDAGGAHDGGGAMTFPMVALGEVLTKSDEWIEIDPNERCQQVTVRLWGKGVVLRDEVSCAEIAASKRLVVHPQQFIVSRIDARNGAFGLIPDSLDGALVSSDFPVFAVNPSRILPKYLEWISKTHFFVDLCKAASEGTTNRVRLKEDRFLMAKIPLPPLAEQRRIVARIEELAAKIEEARGLRKNAGEEVEALLAAKLNEIFSPNRKNNLRLVKIAEICDTSSGGTPSRQRFDFFENGTIPWIKSGELKDTFIKVAEEYITQGALDDSSAKIFPNGTLLIALYGANVGMTGILGLDAATNQAICAVFPKKELLERDYLYWFFRKMRPDYLKNSFGGAQPNISQKMIRETEIAIPSLPEQRRILAYLDELQAKVDVLRRLQAETGAELDALMPAVLDRAFKGEL